jgi:hypothetical protein
MVDYLKRGKDPLEVVVGRPPHLSAADQQATADVLGTTVSPYLLSRSSFHFSPSIIATYDARNRPKSRKFARSILRDFFGSAYAFCSSLLLQLVDLPLLYRLTATQARNFWNHTLRHVKRDGQYPCVASLTCLSSLLGKKLIFVGSADATTKKRTAAITEESQRDYFNLVSHVDERLTRLSKGVDADGKSYADLKVLLISFL